MIGKAIFCFDAEIELKVGLEKLGLIVNTNKCHVYRPKGLRDCVNSAK